MQQQKSSSNLMRDVILLLLAFAAANAFLFFAQRVVLYDSVEGSIKRLGISATPALLAPSDVDSWAPMARAYSDHLEGKSPYTAFFESGVKFQYPPTALLMFTLLPGKPQLDSDRPTADSITGVNMSRMSLIAVLGTILSAAMVLILAPGRFGWPQPTPLQSAFAAGAFCLLGLGFYPLTTAHAFGQIQVFLDLLVSLAVLSWVLGSRQLAGILVGLCVLVKPQYAVVLVWAVLARQWKFALPMSGIVGVLGIVSIGVFGFDAHLQYLKLLKYLSMHGETYWPNQSMNGLVNRLLENGDPIRFFKQSFPPYNRAVHLITVLSSVLLIAAAVSTALGRRSPKNLIFGFCAALSGSTIASPIAWEHHYGIFLALAAVLIPFVVFELRSIAARIALALAFLAISTVVKRPDVFFMNPARGLLASHLYFGALIMFGLMVYAGLRRSEN